MEPVPTLRPSPLQETLKKNHWQPRLLVRGEHDFPPWELDTALRIALDLAGFTADSDLQQWREALFTETRRRLFPERFPEASTETEAIAEYFYPLANAVLHEQTGRGDSIAARLPFESLTEEEIGRWSSADRYRRLLHFAEHDGLVLCPAMAQQWRGLSILDHVLGVTGLSLWIGRQLEPKVPVDLPLLHGAAIGHDIGKFGCLGDEIRLIPRLHYYYTHIWYADRDLPNLGHIATNHSVWDLEQVRLPIETLLLIYADFRVKEWPGADGRPRMQIISLLDAFIAIRDKLENLDKAKLKRYRGVYRKLRDLEEYLQYLGVDLDPPTFATKAPSQPRLPEGLDVIRVLAAEERPDAVALATGRSLVTLRRIMVTAHNLGVMERLRDLPSLQALLEEGRSFQRWRDLRTYQAVIGEYSPALSAEQKAMALDFLLGLLSHRDDDIRYHAANRIGELLAGGEEYWRKDLPPGVELRPQRTAVDELERVLDLLDRAGAAAEEDMGAVERVLYAIPVAVRRLFKYAGDELRQQAWERTVSVLRRRLGDRRPLVGLYVCETFEVMIPYLDARSKGDALAFAREWAYHAVSNTRLMAWRVLLKLARDGGEDEELARRVREAVENIAPRLNERSLVAELYLGEELGWSCGMQELARRCKELRSIGRDPIRDVFLRNLKNRVGWVEKKVNCDYLTSVAHRRIDESRDPGAYFANEVAAHFANMLKVSRVEGTRFHAGRCMLQILPLLEVPQRNDLMVELLRSLELDAEAVTRYIPRFLGSVVASLPDQEFQEALDDIEHNVRKGNEALQRLLLQAVGWILMSLELDRLEGATLRRLTGIMLGALAESRPGTVNEGFAQIAVVLERLERRGGERERLRLFVELATKKLLSLVTHKKRDRVRFFLAASALNHLERAINSMRPAVRFAEKPSVSLVPGTFDPFTTAHQAVVNRALESTDEAMVQMDDYSWRKHALPRGIREELAWMALASVPEAFLAPFKPPINLARSAGLEQLRRRFRHRKLVLVVGSDVVEKASAYAGHEGAIWDFPHAVVVREGHTSTAWESQVERFRGGVSVIQAPASVAEISSTSLRVALDRHQELEPFCHPLVARTLVERQLYLNYPDQKQQVPPPEANLLELGGEEKLPPSLKSVAEVSVPSRVAAGVGRRHHYVLVSDPEGGGTPVAGLTWREVSAAALPVVIGDEALAHLPGGRLLGQGALVERLACGEGPVEARCLISVFSRALSRWLDDGLLFAAIPAPDHIGDTVESALRQIGAAWHRGDVAGGGQRRWAILRLGEPLVLVWDLESVILPRYLEDPLVCRALAEGRSNLADFFAALSPGRALLHVDEEHVKRRVVARALRRLAESENRRQVVLGLGRQFSRDIVGDTPTLAVDIERYLTWQGYESGVFPASGSPLLELQLAVARELGRNALLLAPFLKTAEPVFKVADAAHGVGLAIRDVIVGITEASVRAALELRGIRHHCGFVIPGWLGVLRESAVSPYLGGWSIRGRGPLARGSLLPSLNDCLPYHYPHELGLDEASALDFSRLALRQTRRLLEALEEAFRRAEGRLLSVRDLGAVVRIPRCPPFPEGFLPPRERFPSQLLGDDLEALARLHPETHAAHQERWRER